VYFRRFLTPATLPSLLLSGCASAPSPLRPASPTADDLRWFWWQLFAVAAAVIVVVTVLLIWGSLRTPAPEEEERLHPFGTRLVWIGGIIIPMVILAAVFGLSVKRMVYAGGPPAGPAIQIIGHQWWWEVRYSQAGVVTANEVHIPVGSQAEVRVDSADVIHGVWVPQLQGKIDAIPGITNQIQLESSQPGSYRGSCVVFCALQHANMNFTVIAESQTDFDQWLRAQSTGPAQPSSAELLRGRQVFLDHPCSACHTITGISNGTAGPDLTHVASRSELAAGTIPNTPENLAVWVVDPQSVKPGNLMPNESIPGPDVQALVAYLDSLK
jgi:cytochrome c oxidase subunit II